MATQIGPKIGIEGEREYRQQLKQIINETKNLDAAMQKTASEWTKNTSAMTKNKAIAQNLVQQINNQNQKLQVMNQMLEESAAKFGENSDATKAWQRAVDAATASLNNMQNELRSLNGAENFSNLSTRMADIGTKMQNVGQSMMAVGQKLTMSLTLPIAAAGTAAVKLASDLEEASSKTDVVFGSMSESVKQFAEDALNSYGLAEGTALQMASTFGAMATSMGLSQKQAAAMSTSLTALAADMASFYNVSTDVAQTSLQGVFTGETEALKKFGIVMTQTNLEEFAAKQGKVYSKMSEGEKVMTRYAYVMEATKNAQGDFSRTSDGTANSLRVFQESIKELGAAFGEQLLPIITPIIQALTKLIQKIASLPAPVQKFITVILLLVAAIGPVIMILGVFVSALGGLIVNLPIVIAYLSGLAPVLAAVASAIGPVILVILALAAAFAAGYAIAANWDSICSTVSSAASSMASSVSAAWNKLIQKNDELKDSVNGFVSDVASDFAALPSKIVQALKDAVQKVKDEFTNMVNNAKKSGADMVQGFVDGIKSKVQPLIDQVKKIAKTIEDYLGFSTPDKGPLHKYETWMPDFLNGLAKGIRQNENVVVSAMNSLSKSMALPLDSNASMNMAMAGADGYSYVGGTSMNVYVDHINDLQDLIRIQNQAQQRYRMGAR